MTDPASIFQFVEGSTANAKRVTGKRDDGSWIINNVITHISWQPSKITPAFRNGAIYMLYLTNDEVEAAEEVSE